MAFNLTELARVTENLRHTETVVKPFPTNGIVAKDLKKVNREWKKNTSEVPKTSTKVKFSDKVEIIHI